MTFSIENFHLTDIPFIDIGSLNPSSRDPRENGRIFERKSAKGLIERILSRINFGETVTYVSSRESIKGTGKSALLATVYWNLHDNGRPAVWTNALGSQSLHTTIGRIFEATISEGFLVALRQQLGSLSRERLTAIIAQSYNPSPALVDGVYRVLSQTEWEMTYKLANIKRSLLAFGPSDVFGYFLALLKHVGVPRLYIFLDQFEDYVQSHLGGQAMQRLSDDWRAMLEMFRNRASIVMTTHPEAEQKIRQLPNYRMAPITGDSRVIVDPLTPDEGVHLAMAYLKQFRARGFQDDGLYPFDEKGIQYLASITKGNPRALIGALRTALRVAAEKESKEIDYAFIASPTFQNILSPGAT